MSSLKKAQDMLNKMKEMQDALEKVEVQGESGAGMVKVSMNGKFDVCSVKIDPQLLSQEDIAFIEDLIMAAINDAKRKAENKAAEENKKMMSMLPPIPGLTL